MSTTPKISITDSPAIVVETLVKERDSGEGTCIDFLNGGAGIGKTMAYLVALQPYNLKEKTL